MCSEDFETFNYHFPSILSMFGQIGMCIEDFETSYYNIVYSKKHVGGRGGRGGVRVAQGTGHAERAHRSRVSLQRSEDSEEVI